MLAVAVAGHAIEWYEFAIYGIVAAYIAAAIFPTDDLTVSLFATWTAYAVAFAFRPLGGIVIAHVADRAGRGRALFLSVLLMSVATTLMAIVPGWEMAGLLAPVAFSALRALQGFAVGGEMSSAVCFTLERTPEAERPKAAGVLAAGTFAASLAGSVVASLLIATITDEQMASWGWRALFASAAPLGLIALALRARAIEPVSERTGTASPVRAVLRDHRGAVARFAGVVASYNIALSCAFGGYLNEMLLVGFSRGDAVRVNTATYAVLVIAILAFCRLSARVGRRTTLMIGLVAIAVGFVALMVAVRTGTLLGAMLGGAVMAVPIGIIATPVYLALVDTFPREVRATAGGLGFNIAAAIGSIVPALALGLRALLGTEHGLGLILACALTVSLLIVRRATVGERLHA